MNSLKEIDMQLIELRYFENLSFKEIGDVLQISHGAAKIKLYRSLDKLKKLFNSI
jgi:RNA polymerase sigma-70 factor (ECF subfamily)